MAVRVNVDQTAVANLLYGPRGPVVRMVRRMTDDVEAASKAITPNDTGTMIRSYQTDVSARVGREVRGRIRNTDPAAWWVNRGTGIHSRDGSRGRIVPTRKKVLRFPARRFPDLATGNVLYRRSVEGQRPQEIMWTALRRTALRGVPVLRGRQVFTPTKLLP